MPASQNRSERPLSGQPRGASLLANQPQTAIILHVAAVLRSFPITNASGAEERIEFEQESELSDLHDTRQS
jgi:hypothetical protein